MPAGRSVWRGIAEWSCGHALVLQRRHVDHAINHAGAEETRLHAGSVVKVERHPAEVALPNQAFVRRWRLALQQREVAGEFAGAEIGVVKTLALRRAAPRHLQMLLYRFRRIGAALRRQL